MLKLVVKLAIAALLANAAWRIGSAYVSYYKFKDGVSEEAQFGGDKNADQLRDRVLALAQQYDVPVDESAITITQGNQRTRIAGSYTKQVEVVPGYKYPWPFTWDVETINFARIQPLTPK
jgi:hypothetical protein